MMMSEFIFAYRDWDKDKKLMPLALKQLLPFPDPMWMVDALLRSML